MVVVGAVEPNRAWLWVRAPGPGVHELTIGPDGGPRRTVRVAVGSEDADHTAAFTYPDDFAGERASDGGATVTAPPCGARAAVPPGATLWPGARLEAKSAKVGTMSGAWVRSGGS
jgi:hypothetical protein